LTLQASKFQVRNMRNFASVAAIGVIALSLTACGGGGTLGGTSGSSSGGTSGGTTGGTTTTPTYSLGNGTGSSFQSGMLTISSATLAAGGSAEITATVVDQNGALYTAAPVTLAFGSQCLGTGLAAITPSGVSTAGTTANSVTSATGTVNATYTAKGCSVADVISATTTIGTQSLTATGTITVQAGTIGSIQFLSADPTSIGLKGTGLQETSTVVFMVVDSTGAPRPNAVVNFSVPTNTGSVTLSPTTATTGADGKAQTVVSSGTQHTSVRVTASITDPVLSTQSGALTVTTGLPVSKTFSVSVGSAVYSSTKLVTSPPPACSNIEAASLNQVRVPVTISLADRFQNPAPDNTAVTLSTNAGKVVGACNTGDKTGPGPGSGECVVQWSSEDPRPKPTDSPPSKVANRGLIIATAIGEEYFDDKNGNGFYDTGEVFDDLPEPFRDDNENGTWEAGEYFVDTNHNQMHDGPSGTFKGITCTGNTPTSTCSTPTLQIGKSHLIIMSTSAAQISVADITTPTTTTFDPTTNTLSVAAGQPFGFHFNVQDGSGTPNTTTGLLQNGNPIPAGSSIAVTPSGAVTLNGAPGGIEGCSENIGGDNYLVTGTGGAATTTGTINIVVTAEATQVTTQFSITVKSN
jgi:hypothetical protein